MQSTGTKSSGSLAPKFNNMESTESDLSDAEAREGIVLDSLPSGSEKELIKFYFNRGLTYRHIMLC